MLGFIKKDLYVIKSNLRVILILAVSFGVLAYYEVIDNALPAMAGFITVIMFISTFSYDEYNHWNGYASTLPNGKTNIVKGRYWATIMISTVALIIATLITYLIQLSRGYLLFTDELLTPAIITIEACLIVISIAYPLIFKFGSEKGRLLMFVLIYGGAVLLMFAFNYLSPKVEVPEKIITFLKEWWLPTTVTVTSLVTIASYFISKKIIMKKEF